MKKLLIILVIVSSICFGCKKTSNISESESDDSLSSRVSQYANTITAKELKEMLFTYASDEFQGRKTGEPGQKKAVSFIKEHYVTNHIPSPITENDYFQEIPVSYFEGKADSDSENVIAYIKGSEKPEEVVIITAHLDHIGIKDGEINNGADDDGSGTVALMEIAEAFKAAKEAGHVSKRSIVFLHVTGEELGLFGSRYYADEDPIFPLENTIANLNIDMIGRVDKRHENKPNYLYLIGSDWLSLELHQLSETVNDSTVKLDLDYFYNGERDPNMFYYRSDHYNFAKHDIPSIFYFNGLHDDYHKPTDTPEKINYSFLETRAKLIFYTAWELANRKNRVQLD